MSSRLCTVYKVTNKQNGKIYIGRTFQKPEERWNKHVSESKKESKRSFMMALSKYGRESFLWEVFYQSYDEEHILEIEEKTIARFDSTNRDKGYNNTFGGYSNKLVEPLCGEANGMHGRAHTYEARKSISLANKGRLTGEKNPNYGKERPDYVKESISKKLSGRVLKKIKCPHCLKSGGEQNMKRYHFDNCRNNPYMTEAKKAELDERDRIQSEKLSLAGKKVTAEGRRKSTGHAPKKLRIRICPHCFKEGRSGAMTRFHFDNCKMKESV